MAYKLKTVKRPTGSSPGAASPSKDLVLVKREDCEYIPKRNAKGVVIEGSFVMKPGAEMIELYITPGTQDNNWETEGDADQEGVLQTVQGNHPGDDLEILELIQNNIGVDFFALTRRCDGGNNRLYGTECSPLRMKASYSSNAEGNMHTLTFEQAIATGFIPAVYQGNFSFMDPEVTNEAITAVAGASYQVEASEVEEPITINTSSLEAGDTITLIGSSVAGKLSSSSDVLLAGGADWIGIPGSSITLKLFDGANKVLLEVDRS